MQFNIINQKWTSNPIIPIPQEGCYTGSNLQSMTDDVVSLVRTFESNYQITPTFHTQGGGTWDASNDLFPESRCKTLIELGVIPTIRYIISPFKGYKPIVNGQNDDEFRKFAHKAAKFGNPIILIPFQLPNDPDSLHFEWAGYPAGQYREAWVRMHDLFKQEGANKNTIWATKLKIGWWREFSYRNPFPYCLPKEHVDIIGWACNNHNKPEIGLYSQPFTAFFDSYYKEARRKFPNKPQIFWELSSARGRQQAKWLDEGLTLIKNKYHGVKGVMLDETYYSGIGDKYGSYDPTLTEESIKVVKNHFTSGYFIGSTIKK